MIADSIPRQCWHCGGTIERVQIGLSDHWRCLSCFALSMHRHCSGGRSQSVRTYRAGYSPEDEEAARYVKQHERRKFLAQRGHVAPPPRTTVDDALDVATEASRLAGEIGGAA